MFVEAFLLASSLLIPAHAQSCRIPKSPQVIAVRRGDHMHGGCNSQQAEELIRALQNPRRDNLGRRIDAVATLACMLATPQSLAALRSAAGTSPSWETTYPEYFDNVIRARSVLALAALGDCAWVDLARKAYQDLRMDQSSPGQALAADLAYTLAYAGHLDGWPTIRTQLLDPQFGSSQFQQHGALLISLIRRQLLSREVVDTLYAALPYRNRLPARAYLYP